jgi:ABC-type polysaccharide/polyol phosphate export permease
MQALSPLAVLATLFMPGVFAFILHRNANSIDHVSSALAVGCAGVGMLDSIIVLVVFSLLGEKQWRTLSTVLGSPAGLAPVVLGRLVGIAVQLLATLPGTLVILALLWGIDARFDWWRWAIGGVLLALSTTAVVGLLGFAVLRYPYSPGMTNGLTGLVMAFSALIVPVSALPGPVRSVAAILPQSHVMTWVRSGGVAQFLLAVVLTAGYVGLVVASMRRVEMIARNRALALEA